MNTTPVANIYDEDEELVTIKTGDGRTYDIFPDRYSEDWTISCEDDIQIQSEWLADRDSAIQYVLGHLGIIENPIYDRAPERC